MITIHDWSTRVSRVLLIGDMYHPAGKELLYEHAQVELIHDVTYERIIDRIPEATGVVVRYPHRLQRECIRAAKRLRVISTSGRGTDSIDVTTATLQGIPVVNNPGLSSVAVAEQTLALLLGLARHVPLLDAAVRSGRYDIRDGMYQIQVRQKTLGISGLGSIGTEVARKCHHAFNMRVIAYDPYVTRESATRVDATLVNGIAELLTQADFVSLHPELNDETCGMIGQRELCLMKPEAYLINTARGKIVNEEDLVAALQQNQIAGAALDVFEYEPPDPNNPLFQLDNVILSPHMGGVTKEGSRELALSAARQILQVFAGQRPPHLVNCEVWPRGT